MGFLKTDKKKLVNWLYMERGSKIVLNTNSPKKICEDSMPMTAGYNMYLQCIEQYGQINEINVKLTLFPVRLIFFSFISFVTNRAQQYHQSH
jgi:hypothetical protein